MLHTPVQLACLTCQSSKLLLPEVGNVNALSLQQRPVYRPVKKRKTCQTTYLQASSQRGEPVTAEIVSADALPESTALQAAEDLGYHSIEMEGCEVLIAATDDGRLDLSSVFVHDFETDIFSEPERAGQFPNTQHRYAETEWVEEFLGDSLQSQEAWRKVLKVYLVQVQQDEPFRLDLEQVFSIDSQERVLRKEEVLWLTDERDPRLITLRIRPEGLYIQENSEMMSEYHIAESHLIAEEQARVEALRERIEEGEPAAIGLADSGMVNEAARDPLDALNDDEREYDETMEDTPEVDQGF